MDEAITDLMASEHGDPRRAIAFNTTEHWSDDGSEDIAREIQRRADPTFNDVPSAL